MLTANDLLESAKRAQGIPSNYRLARVLGVTETTVANWKHARSTPDDAMALRLAEMAGLDPSDVLPAMYALRATDPAIRATWRVIAERLAATAAGVCMSVAITGGPDAHASAPAAGACSTPGQSVYYVNRLLRLMRRAFAALARNPAPTGLALA